MILLCLTIAELPVWTAGSHIDVVVAPGFIRQYSLTGNPADRTKYQIGVLREEDGKGGSVLMHRIFTLGRKIFISNPINHFSLEKLFKIIFDWWEWNNANDSDGA